MKSGEKNHTVVRLDIVKQQQRPHVHKMDGHQNHCMLVCSAVEF